MIIKKLILASSSELKEDRTELEIFMNRKNKHWVDRGVFIQLIVWEDFLDAVSKTRLQDEYNKVIRECDLFVMLFFTKVGRYIEEEFETAFGQFRATNKPFIFTYFKDTEISTGSARKKDLMSLWAFQEKLDALGHFKTPYKTIDQLKYHFNQQLDKLAASGFFELKSDKDQVGALGGMTHEANLAGGGAYIGDSVDTGSGDFVGRDRITHGVRHNFGTIVTDTQIVQHYHASGSTRLSIEEIAQQVVGYLRWLRSRTENIELRGVERAGGAPVVLLPLETAYVPLRARSVARVGDTRKGTRARRQSARSLGPEDEAELGEHETDVQLNEVLGLGKQLVIIGGPGCGKTTVLAHLAWALASSLLTGQAELARSRLGLTIAPRDLPLPIFVPLASFARYRRQLPGNAPERESTLAHFISHHLISKQADFDLPADFFAQLLKDGREVALLLDGLDEVENEDERAEVRQSVEELVSGREAMRVVVSCRTVAYQSGRTALGADFREIAVQPLDWEQHIAPMVRRAYACIYPRDTALRDQRSADLLRGIQGLEHGRRTRLGKDADVFVDSPLMVRLLLILHINTRKLPTERADLVGNVIRALVQADYGREESHIRELATDWKPFRDMAQHLAFHMHREGPDRGLEIEEPALRSALCQEAEFKPRIDDFLSAVCQRGSVLEQRGNVYRFIHLEFQEFLAARYLCEMIGGREAILAFLKDRLDDPWWREPIRLYAELERDASALIHALLSVGTIESRALAFECLERGARISAALRQLVQLGDQAIRRYFAEERRAGITTLLEAKLLLVGQGKAGKTTLRRKLEDPHAPMPAPGDTTRGIEITRLDERMPETDEPLRINVWDFGGQDIQHYAHQFFLTGSSLYALVTNERIQDSVHLPYWLNIIEMLGKKSPVILIQNKEGGHCQPLREEAAIRARFGNAHNRVYQTDFSRAATEAEFAELRREIVYQAARLPHVKQTYPATFFELRGKLEAKADQGTHYLPWQIYCALMPRLPEDIVRQYANVLTFLGVCQYFPDDVLLRDYVFLRPQWIIEALFALLLHPSLEATGGHFTENDTVHIWQGEEYRGMHALLVRMMRLFDFCYRIEGEDDSYILPQRLPRMPEGSNTYGWNELDDSPVQYKYKFMPKGILTRLICRLHQRIEKNAERRQQVWSDAAIFALPDRNGRVFAREVYSENTIELRAAGDKRGEILNEVIRKIDDINVNRKYENLQVDKLVPCPCPRCAALGENRFFHKYDILTKSLDKGYTTSRCENSIEDIEIGLILGKSGVTRRVMRRDLPVYDEIQDTAMAITPLKIFISYSHAQREYYPIFKADFVDYTKIPDLPVEVFSDDGIPIGADWDECLQTRVAECDVMILLISQQFMNSRYIQEKEFGTAVERLKQERSLLIAPIYFAPCQFTSDQELSRLQFFKPHGKDFDEARKGDKFSYVDLVRFNRDNGLPIPNPNLQHYMEALIENLKPDLRKLSSQKRQRSQPH